MLRSKKKCKKILFMKKEIEIIVGTFYIILLLSLFFIFLLYLI